MKPIVVFGIGKIAEAIVGDFLDSSSHQIAAFTVHDEYLAPSPYDGIPVIPFRRMADSYPPSKYDAFVATGYQGMNTLRADMVNAVRQLGYELARLIHPNACVSNYAQLGENCLVMPFASVLPRTTLADNVFVWNNVVIAHHTSIGENCWLAAGANIMGSVDIGANCFVGATATVGHDVQIGSRCFLGAASLVTRNIPENKVVVEKASGILKISSDQFLKMIKFR